MDILFGAVRWIGSHGRGLYAVFGVFLLAGLGLAALSVARFALVAEGVTGGGTQRLDQALVDGVRSWRSGRPWRSFPSR